MTITYPPELLPFADPEVDAEVLVENPDTRKLVSITQARMSGYTGDMCGNCGGVQMRRNGSCLFCDGCGTTTGCS